MYILRKCTEMGREHREKANNTVQNTKKDVATFCGGPYKSRLSCSARKKMGPSHMSVCYSATKLYKTKRRRKYSKLRRHYHVSFMILPYRFPYRKSS